MSADPGRARRLALVGVVLLSAYAWFYQGGGWNQNSRFALARALAEQGSVRLDATARYEGRAVTGDLVRRGRHTLTDKAPGASLVAAPAVVLARALGPSDASRASLSTLSWVATVAAAGLPTTLAALLLVLVAESLGASRRAALLAALTFGLGTPAWCQATLLFGHALSGACLWAAFAAATALRTPGGAARDRALGWGVGLGAGWAVVTEFPAAVPAALLAGYALWEAGAAARRREVAWRLAAGALLCALVLGGYNLLAFGSPFALGYGSVQGFEGMQRGVMGVTFPKPGVLFEILVGRYRGLLPLAPVLALSPVGLWWLARDPSTRRAGLTAAAVAAWYLLFNSAYHYWDGGYSFGPRHLLPSLPFLSLGLAPLWTRATVAGRRALAALTAWGFVACLVGVSVNAQPPESVRAPMSELLWPAFVAGRLALNPQSIVDAGLAAVRDPSAHATNLGERLGLRGHATLAPLALLWAIAGALSLRGAPSAAPPGPAPPPGPAAPRRRARARRSTAAR